VTPGGRHRQAPFGKQLGTIAGWDLGAGPKGADWNQWSEDLKVRKFPRPARREATA
jgi:hypothetical protein